MIMPHHNHIEARNALGNLHRRILTVLARHGTSLVSRMKDTYHNIRLLLLLNDLHPFTGRLFHIGEIKTLPQSLRQPYRNSRSNHPQYNDLHTVTLKYLIGL